MWRSTLLCVSLEFLKGAQPKDLQRAELLVLFSFEIFIWVVKGLSVRCIFGGEFLWKSFVDGLIMDWAIVECAVRLFLFPPSSRVRCYFILGLYFPLGVYPIYHYIIAYEKKISPPTPNLPPKKKAACSVFKSMNEVYPRPASAQGATKRARLPKGTHF